MPYSNIDSPKKYFDTKLYTGTGATQSITGLSFKPDWVWLKNRNSTEWHSLFDAVRGSLLNIRTNSTNAEVSATGTLTSFNSDGFSLGTDPSSYGVNTNTNTYVSWNWLGANTTVSNTQGSITSTVSANTTSGFSIVSYTGTGANATVGHGLGVAPNMIICKSRTQAQNWAVYHSSLGNTKALFLDGTSVGTSASYWNNTSPTSTVFTVGNSGDVNYNAGTQISYCFSSVKGYSKFGSYTGNGNADGTFVYTGFKPAMIIAKQDGGQAWQIHDTARDTFNLATRVLFPNSSSAEQNSSANGALDILSNGFKWRMADADQNGSGSTYYYMAFASSPFVSSKSIPTTAR